MTPTQQLAAFCAGLRWPAIPSDARERTKELVLDHVGVAIRGSATESARAIRRYVAPTSRGGRSSPLGAEARATAPGAAVAHGGAAPSLAMGGGTTRSPLPPGVAP